VTVLVTGGAGYVGSHTVRLLTAQGRRVVVLDNLTTGSRRAVGSADLVVGDVRDQGLVAGVLGEHRVDAVIHFAGCKTVSESMDDPGRYFDNNVVGTLSVLRAVDASQTVKGVVFSSSCSVYGTPASVPVREEADLHPESPYGESKRIAEQILSSFSQTRGLRFVSLRYFNAAGASLDAAIGEDWDLSVNLVPVALKAACGAGPPLRVFGNDYPTVDGTAVRDYVHVVDLADAHARALDYLTAGGPSDVLNLGTGKGTSVMQVIDAAAAVTGRPVPTVFSPRRPGDPSAVWADNARASRVIGWHPTLGLTDMVESAWRWHAAGMSSAE
jgi:UDP-glucose-4-epimerase GalE